VIEISLASLGRTRPPRPSRRNLGRALSYFAIAALSVAGCSVRRDFDAAETAAEIFHREMAAGQYDMTYDNATESFQAAISRKDFVEFCSRVNRKMGVCQPVTLISKHFMGTPQGSHVRLSYKRGCMGGELTEQLDWLVVGSGRAALNHLSLNSPKLLKD
jgi:hypothetical protein